MNKQQRLPAAERRAQIAEAALGILATQGARQLTAKAIGLRVGITDGAVFRHFADKGEIIAAAIDTFEAALNPPPQQGPPLERLEIFFIERVTRVRERPEILGLAFNDRLQEAAGEEGAKRVQRLIGRSLGFVRKCVREAQARGELDATIDVDVYTAMVTGCMRFGARSRHRPESIWLDVMKVFESKETP